MGFDIYIGNDNWFFPHIEERKLTLQMYRKWSMRVMNMIKDRVMNISDLAFLGDLRRSDINLNFNWLTTVY